MQLVAAGASDHVNDAVPGTAHLCGESRGGNLKLGNGVLRQVAQRSADDLVVVVATIDGDVAAATEAAR